LPTTTQDATLILVPYNQFSEADLSEIKKFVTTGGTLILLDDYGKGNQVLNSLGINIKFSGQPLLDPLFDYCNKRLPKITDFSNTSLVNNVTSIVFNHATTLEATGNATVIAYSSRFSFLDANNNEEWDNNEKAENQPVAAYQKMGQGYVVVVADPSLLINSMIEMDDNLQFINNLASLQSTHPQIYLDQTHLSDTSLDKAKTSLSIVYTAAATPIGTTVLVAVLLIVTLYPVYRKVRKNE
jgi:hypothetical protein